MIAKFLDILSTRFSTKDTKIKFSLLFIRQKNISLWYRHERWWQRLTLKELLKHNKQINDGETAGNIRNRVSLVPLVLTVHLVYMWSRDIFTKVSIDIMIPLCNCVRQNWRTSKLHKTISVLFNYIYLFALIIPSV